MIAPGGMLAVARGAALVGFRDNQAIFTVGTWLSGWLLRVVAQVIFFALIGRLVDDPDVTTFLVVGNVAMLAAMTAMRGARLLPGERMRGTLPGYIAAPVTHIAALIPRLAYNIADAALTVVLAAPIVFALFEVSLPAAAILPALAIVALVSATSGALAAFAGALLLWRTRLRHVGTNVVTFSMMVCCGVNVPIGATPEGLAAVGWALPLTRGLQALRHVLAGGDLDATVGLLAGEALTGLAWLAGSIPIYLATANRGRRTGNLFES